MANKTITPISNVRVTLIGEVTKDNLQETVCTYKFKGQDVNRFIFVECKKGESKTSCINKAKKELARLHKTGALEAYSNRYIKGMASRGGGGLTRKGIAILASASVIAAGALITGGIFIGKALINNPYRPTVTFNAARAGAHFGNNPALTKISINVDKGAKVSDFIDAVNIPTLKYNDFKAWTLDGYEIERDYVIDTDTTFDASYASQKTTIYLEAGGDGYGSLTPLTKQQAQEYSTINDMVHVASFTVDRGTTLGDAFTDEEGQLRFRPDIHLADENKKDSYKVKGWSLDGGATYIDFDNPDEALLQKPLDEEKYTFVAGYDLKGQTYADITDFKPNTWASVVFNSNSVKADTDKTEQTGQWDYYVSSTGATNTIHTLGLMLDPSHIKNLNNLRDRAALGGTWYDEPMGDYASFDYWYDSHDIERTKIDPSKTIFVAGGDPLNLTCKYTPHFSGGVDFVQDSWRAVINNANLGLDHLHYVYEEDIKNNKQFPGTLVGLVRSIDMPDPNHNDANANALVRVIGEAQDYAGALLKSNISGGSGSGSGGVSKASDYVYTRPVALTFEFFTAVLTPPSVSSYGSTSYLYSEVYGATRSIQNVLPDELLNNIRTVKKFVPLDSGLVCDVVDLKCFDLSLTEYRDTLPTTPGAIRNELLVDGVANTYKYYTDSASIKPARSHYLRSLNEGNYCFVYNTEEKRIEGEYYTSSFMGDVFPAFCIGRK